MAVDKTKYRIGKTFISRTNPSDAIRRVTDAAVNHRGGYVCVSNMRMLNYAAENLEFNQLMTDSFMNWPDGRPLAWCGRIWGLKDVECTRGPSIFMKVMSSPVTGLKHFLFGDTQEVLDEIVAKYPDAGIVGVYSPPFVPLEEFDFEGIASLIKESGANVVWTAMTAPKQDEFDRKLMEFLPEVVAIGVGRAFRLSVDRVKDAPGWAQKAGVGGMFIGKSSKARLVWWYLKKTLVMMGYFLSILYKRIRRTNYYE